MSAIDFSDSCRTHHASVDLARGRRLIAPRPSPTRLLSTAACSCGSHPTASVRCSCVTRSRDRATSGSTDCLKNTATSRTDQARCCLRRSWADPVPRPTRRRLDSGRGHTTRGRGFGSRCSSSAPGRADFGGRAPGLRREKRRVKDGLPLKARTKVRLPCHDRATAGYEEWNKTGCGPLHPIAHKPTGDS
jgi:hypothetical protein